MASRSYGQVLHQIHRLFQGGSVAGLSERQLLDRYANRRDEAAFEALVARHGPMVLGVCRRMLDDPHAVEDAFQATFLVLVRRAGAFGPRDAVGHWLYGVACRVALRARCESARRRSREVPVEWAQGVAAEDGEPGGDELAPILDEELGRLPPKYRKPVVLCYLEGLTHEEAARQLSWPVGSVKGRLARARTLLKERLARRGVVPTAGLLVAAMTRDAGAAVPEPLRQAAVRAALAWTAASASASGRAAPAVISASVARLMEGGLSAMFLTKLKVAAAIVGTCGGLALGAWALAQPTRDQEARPGTAGAPAPAPTAVAGATSPRTSLEALDRPLPLELHKASLQDVLKAIKAATASGTSSGVPIYVEPEGLEEAGATLDAPVTIDARKVPLLTAIDRALRPLKLGATTRDGLLVITSRQEAALIEIRKLNEQLRGTTPIPAEPAASQDISPSGWLSQFKDRRVVVSSHDDDDKADPEAEARTRAILDALRKPVPMEFANETPLEDVLAYIKTETKSPALPGGIPIYVDPVGLQEAEKQVTSPVTLNLTGVALRESLKLALAQLGLVYTVSDGLLTISNEDSSSVSTPILALSEKATRGELNLREMEELIMLFEARDRVMQYAAGMPPLPAPRGEDALENLTGRFILMTLERVVPLRFDQTPVDAAIAAVRKATISRGLPHGIPIYVAPDATTSPTGTPVVSIDLEGAKLKTVLRLMLGQAGLGYTVRDGQLIVDRLGSLKLKSDPQ